MVWVKFHEELTKGAKRGIPREYRFVLMELALICRPKRGWVDLPLGMDDLEGVYDLLGGNRNQVVRALQIFTSGDDPSIVFGGESGSRRLSMPKWAEWNSSDVSTERVKKHRDTSVETRFNSKRNANETLLEESRVDQIPPGGVETPQQLSLSSPEPDKPRAKRTKTDKGDAPESDVQIAWRLWRELYRTVRRGYDKYIDPGDGPKVIERLVLKSKEVATDYSHPEDWQSLLKHWYTQYLKDDGFKDMLVVAKHPLRHLERDLLKYGVPWRAKQTATVAPRVPEPQLVAAPVDILKGWSPKL